MRTNAYADSMSLMGLSAKVNDLPYVIKAVIGMATELNKGVMGDVGLLTPEVEAATSRDQVLVVQCATEADCDRALAEVDIIRANTEAAGGGDSVFRTAREAFAQTPGANMVLISVPGEYAAAEARQALSAGKNVMIFSDNVSVSDELELKTFGHEHGLLVMGPDCGTAIINNVGLCFANAVRPGNIGIVAASGTGSQELSVRVDALGAGISQLIGVGGRDLSEDIGGVMMRDGLAMLDADPDTAVIVVLSKPPADAVATRVLDAVTAVSTPVVVCFIGSPHDGSVDNGRVTVATNTRDAALAAVRLATGNPSLTDTTSYDFPYSDIHTGWAPGQRFIRGLFCGGTVCDEIFHVIRAAHEDTFTNIAKTPANLLSPGESSRGHTLIDLGADEFTRGRPHPMIDPTLRNSRIVAEATDPKTAVIALDFELGRGSHPAPVSAAVSAIQQARKVAAESGRTLEFIAYVLGTDTDPQGKADQISALDDLGVRVVASVIDLGEQALKLIPQRQESMA
ncbi:acyl-CoA synthetase FdrA [Mycobacterium sp. 21AC1]|uniref:acyl-CoA synthetase FdrA n=1 Tax=[Mycobacterium] appelbergii TaxID=2939269 RepID=UPI0029393B89|nr:acyl-CoA synthetase FdrA [Mycobacterium sp. 21AC1]MDV3124904.1 acyl-CoA synthetase FdrA [Mycobacterium sp. 21AC1]